MVADALHLPEGHWAVISAIIVMQSSIGATVDASWNRLVGTAIGALLGAVFAVFWGTDVVAMGVAIALTVWVCSSLGLMDSFRLAGVTVIVVMLFQREASYPVIAVRRFLEVSVGILVSLGVTALTWSSRARKRLRDRIVDMLVEMSLLYEAVLQRQRGDPTAPVNDLRAKVHESLRAHASLLKQANFEPAMGIRPAVVALWRDHLQRVYLAIEALELATRDGPSRIAGLGFEDEVAALVGAISTEFHELSRDVVAGRLVRQREPLETKVRALDQKMAEVGRERGDFGFGLERTLRVYAFISALRNLARELDMAREVIVRGESALDENEAG